MAPSCPSVSHMATRFAEDRGVGAGGRPLGVCARPGQSAACDVGPCRSAECAVARAECTAPRAECIKTRAKWTASRVECTAH